MQPSTTPAPIQPTRAPSWLSSFLRNRDILETSEGVKIPALALAARFLRDVMTPLRGQAADPVREVMLEAPRRERRGERIVLFNDSFI